MLVFEIEKSYKKQFLYFEDTEDGIKKAALEIGFFIGREVYPYDILEGIKNNKIWNKYE